MTPQELKNSILQQAIQGKLVEQRTEEGTAEELFQQIQKEKQRLIAEGKIKDNKKIELISEEIIPFDIPDSWKWTRFGNLVSYYMGKTPPRIESEWWGPDIPWVSIADMSENGYVRVTKECVTSIAVNKKFGGKISKAGTLLMSFKLTVGRVSILDIDAVHNEAIISIYPLIDNESVQKMYLFYVLPFISQFGESKNAIKGKTLNDSSIGNLLIPLPPLAEQKRIVAKIEELLPYIHRYEESWLKLEAFNSRFPDDMKKSLLQYAIQGKLVEQRPEEGTAEELFQQIQKEKQRLIADGKIKKEKPLPEITEDEKPFDIPESWKWVRLGSVFLTSSGTTPARSNLEYYTNGKINWVRTTDLNNAVLNSCEVKISTKAFDDYHLEIIPRNSICIAMYGGAGTIGKNARIDFDTTINQSVCAVHPNILCDMKYVHYFVQFFRPFWMNYAAGSRKDPNINQIIIKNACFPLPPLPEQKRIVAKLEQLLPLCERLK